MDFFTKPVDQLVFADVEALRVAGAAEGLRLEFKSQMPLEEELMKKVSAFANSYGGRIIIGAAEERAKWTLKSLDGVAPEVGFDQKLSSWCAAHAHPPIHCSVSKPLPCSHDANKVLYVIDVPMSMEAPHFLNGRKGVYVRFGDASHRVEAQLANFEEITQLANRRALAVERRNSLSREALAIMEHHVTAEGSDRHSPRLQLLACPTFPSQRLLDETGLSTRLPARQSHRDVDYLVGVGRLRATAPDLILDIGNGPTRPVLVQSTWGLLGAATRLPYEQGVAGEPINLNHLAGHVCGVVRFCAAFWSDVGYLGPVTYHLHVAFGHCRSLEWQGTRLPAHRPILSIGTGFSLEVSVAASGLAVRPEPHFTVLLERLHHALGLEHFNGEATLSLDSLVDMGMRNARMK